MAFGELTVYIRQRERRRLREKEKRTPNSLSALCFTTLFYKYVSKILVIAKPQNLFVL